MTIPTKRHMHLKGASALCGKMRKLLPDWPAVAFALFGFCLSASQACADGQTDSDLRCLIVSIQMSGSSDASTRNAGTMAALYFLGRLDGRYAGLDLGKEVTGAMSKNSQVQLQFAARACGALLSSRGGVLKVLGAELASAGLFKKLH